MSERDERVRGLATLLAGCDPDPCDPIEYDAGRYYRDFAQALLDSPAMRDLLAEAWDECAVAVHIAFEEGMVGRLNEPGDFLRGARRMRVAAKRAYESNPYQREAR